MPGVARENYWFRRHEAVYQWITSRILGPSARPTGSAIPTDVARQLADRIVVDAGCGEGYGAVTIAAAGARCIAVDLDAMTINHVACSYQLAPATVGRSVDQPAASRSDRGSGAGWLHAVAANLDGLPLRTASVDLVVSLQVVEHLWDLRGFLGECLRVLRPGGELIISTPNRVTFSPGLGRGERPTNPFHVEEFDVEQLTERVACAGFRHIEALGLRHGPRIVTWEREHGGIVAAQVAAIQSERWPADLDSFVATVTTEHFDIASHQHTTRAPGAGLRSNALDLIIVGQKPSESTK